MAPPRKSQSTEELGHPEPHLDPLLCCSHPQSCLQTPARHPPPDVVQQHPDGGQALLLMGSRGRTKLVSSKEAKAGAEAPQRTQSMCLSITRHPYRAGGDGEPKGLRGMAVADQAEDSRASHLARDRCFKPVLNHV